MKMNKIYTLLLACSLMMLSCGGEKNSPNSNDATENEVTTEKKAGKQKVQPTKAGYFVDLKNHIGLTDKQLYDLKVIVSRTGNVKKKYIADGEWEGPEYKEKRKQWRDGQRAELRALLGNELFNKKLRFDNAYFQAVK